MTPDLLQSLVFSASLGALIGLERQWEDQRDGTERRGAPGVRTFTLWSLTGTLCAAFELSGQAHFFAIGLAVLALFLTVFAIASPREEAPGYGLTTSMAGVFTYLLGGMAAFGERRLALVLAVALIVLLASKSRVHGLSRRFTSTDMRTALQFAVVTGLVLPLVPDVAFGPFDAFNPRHTWLMVVLVSGLGFCGYVASRALGERAGVALTGFVGGLASSTATTLAMSRESRARPDLGPALTAGIVLACTVMLGRILLLVAALDRGLATTLATPFGLLAVPGLLYGIRHLARPAEHGPRTGGVEVRNPLGLRTALTFAVLYSLIVLAVKAASHHLGSAGLYATAFVSGLTDLDAIALSVARMRSAGALESGIAVEAIVLAALANTLLKMVLAVSLGGPALRRPVLVVFGLTLAAGTAWWLIR